MALKIRNAILHILRNDGRTSTFSETELDIASETCEAFIAKHVKRLMNNPAVRSAHFTTNSPMYEWLSDYQAGRVYFKETARNISEKLDGIMQQHATLPPCDLLIARVADKHGEYISIVKLYCQEVYAHQSRDADNQITKQMALPFSSGKAECSALITLGGDAMPISLMEKEVVIDGEVVPYFSEHFLECEAAPSRKEQVMVIDEINTSIVHEFYNDNPLAAARVKTALVEEAEATEGFISVDNVAVQAFADNQEAQQQYVQVMQDAGLRGEVPLGAKFTKQQFGTQRIKSDNGVELKFPAEMALDSDAMEIERHSDGRVSVTFKFLTPLE